MKESYQFSMQSFKLDLRSFSKRWPARNLYAIFTAAFLFASGWELIQ